MGNMHIASQNVVFVFLFICLLNLHIELCDLWYNLVALTAGLWLGQPLTDKTGGMSCDQH